ncbi:MAG TPA: hypothetical protein VGI75_11535, partial [Pirellulales bacterium]
MSSIRWLVNVSAILAFTCLGSAMRGDEPISDNPLLRGVEPLMVCCTKRDPPSPQEWSALSHEPQRSALSGSIADFKSRTVAFNNSRYYTANATEGTLASYGKTGSDKRYDRFGQIDGVEFSIDQNSWKERYVLNAAALLKLTGSRFLEYAGVGLEAAVDKNRQIDVTFLGTNVPKDKVIRRLNSDVQALEYFDTLQQKFASYDREKFKLGKTAPPMPKVVLANVIMLTGNFSSALNASADASLHSRVLQDGIELKMTMKNGDEFTLLSPVVRCYRTYSIEFKSDVSGNPVRELRI